jgi:hypothetical protein
VSHPSASTTAGRRGVGKRIGCVGIVCAAAVTLGLSVNHGLRATASFLSPASVRQNTAAYRQEECIYRAIRSELPEGATVYVDSPAWPVQQRLAELSTLWAVPQPSLATARWKIFLVAAQHHCFRLALEVRRT